MKKILLAEDDDGIRRFLSTSLVRVGHDVQDYPDGESALEALQGNVFDLLVTDIVMPGMDGIALARHGSALNPDMKIVFITGFAAVALSRNAADVNGAKVLSKPFHLRELVTAIETIIDD